MSKHKKYSTLNIGIAIAIPLVFGIYSKPDRFMKLITCDIDLDTFSFLWGTIAVGIVIYIIGKKIVNMQMDYDEVVSENKNLIGHVNHILLQNNKSIASFFRNSPFTFFSKQMNHTGVIGTLIQKSLEGELTSIKNISEETYMQTIQEAIVMTNQFCGVNLKSIKFFHETYSKEFHETFNFRLRDIHPKGRIFVLDKEQYKTFKKELKNRKLIKKFHKQTFGINTFYVKYDELLSALKTEYPNITLIRDFGIYDNLIISHSYQDEMQYKLISSDDVEVLIYEKLFDHLKQKNFELFTPLFLYTFKDISKKHDKTNGVKFSVKECIYSVFRHQIKSDDNNENFPRPKYKDIDKLIKDEELWTEFYNESSDFKKDFDKELENTKKLKKDLYIN